MNTDRLVLDMQVVAKDAEDLLKATAGDVSDKVKEARDRLGETLDGVRETYFRWQDKAAAGVKATDRTIREHPYQSMGAALAVGLLIGVLVNRSTRN